MKKKKKKAGSIGIWTRVSQITAIKPILFRYPVISL